MCITCTFGGCDFGHLGFVVSANLNMLARVVEKHPIMNQHSKLNEHIIFFLPFGPYLSFGGTNWRFGEICKVHFIMIFLKEDLDFPLFLQFSIRLMVNLPTNKCLSQ